MTVKGI